MASPREKAYYPSDSPPALGDEANVGDGYKEEKHDPTTASDLVLRASDGQSIASDTQDGVKKAQATTIVWSRKALIIVYGLIFLIFFVNSLAQQILNNLVPFVTSAFEEHSLTSTTSVVSTLVAGIIKLPTAKIMDVWGRPQGFSLMLFCTVIGLVMMAGTNNVTTYAAAQVFYWVGYDGIAYVLDVFIADTSSLQWRALMFAFSTSPYIATTFAGPAAAEAFFKGPGWRWGYGAFAIITPFICLTFLTVFWYNQHMAIKQGILSERAEAHGRTLLQSFRHYMIEFDVVGILLLCAGWALLLLPFSLATSEASKWRSASTIAMLVVGFCLLIAFAIFERFFAKKSFLPFHLLVDRTVAGSCLLAATLFVSFYIWDIYFTSYLQVVNDLSIADAGFLANTYNIGSTFFAIVVGFAIRYSGRFKWCALLAVPLQILGTGLMIHFRQPGQKIGYVAMCQIFIACSGGTIVVTEQLAIMAAVGPDNVAVALALQGLFSSIGGAIGVSIGGAIWTNTLPGALERFLVGTGAEGQAAAIYDSLVTAKSYAVGTPERDAIIAAYAYTQRFMCIASTAVLPLAFVWVLMWRDIKVSDFKKPNGAKIV